MLRSWFLLTLLLTGCSVPFQIPGISPTSNPTVTISPPAAADTAEPETENCAFVWSTRSLPDLSIQVTDAFRLADMSEVEVEASAYGEDCIDSVTNEVVRFSAMQTDFYFSVSVPDTNDKQVLGDWIEKIYQVMAMFPPGGEIPGPNPGYFGVTFSGGGEPVILWFRRLDGEDLLDQGLRGSQLVNSLLTPQ